MYGGSASRNRTTQNGDRRSQKEETRGLYHRHIPEVSPPGEPPSWTISCLVFGHFSGGTVAGL